MMPNKGIAVDGACCGNPGPSKYRGIDIETGEIVFSTDLGHATNNVCEFLALCHAIGWAINNNQRVVYSDSITAIAWVKKKSINSSLVKHEKTAKARSFIKRSIEFLESVDVEDDGIDLVVAGSVSVLKWHTSIWGEIPADYGNKTNISQRNLPLNELGNKIVVPKNYYRNIQHGRKI